MRKFKYKTVTCTSCEGDGKNHNRAGFDEDFSLSNSMWMFRKDKCQTCKGKGTIKERLSI